MPAWLFGIARRMASEHRPALCRATLRIAEGSTWKMRLAGTIATAMASLPAGHAEVLSLRYQHGLSLTEVAGILRTSVNAIKGRQQRALEALHAQILSLP